MNRNHDPFIKKEDSQYTNIKGGEIGFNMNIKKIGLLFHYKIISYHLLVLVVLLLEGYHVTVQNIKKTGFPR